jgi:uncharacterized coiled-coil protein SlyX
MLFHPEIAYEGLECPLCEKEKEIDRLQREIEKLREKLGEKVCE